MKIKLTIAMLMIAGAAWGSTNIIYLRTRPTCPVVGQSYKFGDDPNVHTYMGGSCWASTLLQWHEIGEDVTADSPYSGKGKATTNDLDINAWPYPAMTNAPCPRESEEELVNRLAKSGAICAIYGHWWVYPLYKDNGRPAWDKIRKCELCGKVETYTEVWK